MLIVVQDVEDGADEIDGVWEAPVSDGEVVVFDRGDVYAEDFTACREMGVVREELMRLCEINEGLDTRE